MPTAIFWDMDGTLLDSEPLHEAALVAALEAMGIVAPPEFHSLVVGRDARAIHGWCAEHLGLTLALEPWLRLKYRTYFASLDRLQPREGAVELFHEMRAAGATQAVVSNSDRLVVAANLDAAGLSAPAQLTVSRNDVRRGKPDPEPYLRAAWLTGAEPARCIAVEDSVTGARAGVAAGMRTLFWPQSEQGTPSGAERIKDMAHLASVLKEGF